MEYMEKQPSSRGLTLQNNNKGSESQSRVSIQELIRDLPKLLSNGRSERTVDAICQRLKTYREWADAEGLQDLPGKPEVVIRFLNEMEARGRKGSTIRVYASAISAAHDVLELPNPVDHPLIREAVHHLRYRDNYTQPQALALSENEIRQVLLKLESPRAGRYGWTENSPDVQKRAKTEKALLLVMTQAGLRRSEASNLTWGNIRRFPDDSGLVAIKSGYAARFGLTFNVAVKPDCMNSLTDLRPHFVDGPATKVFDMSPWQIPRHLKAMCEAAGIDPTHVNSDTPRRSLIRIMTEKGAPLEVIQRHARLRVQSTLMLYVHEADARKALSWM